MLLVIRRVLAAAAVVAIVLVLPAGVLAQAQDGYKWSKAAVFPKPQEELYGLALNGKMYVVGGFGTSGKPQGLMYEYDPATDKWTKKADMPVPAHHQAQAIYQNKIYTFGGCLGQLAGPGATDNSFEYDPAADTWKALAPMPVKMCSAKAEQVGGKIYVIGGVTTMEDGTGTRVTGLNQMYDPATNKWEQRSPMPTTRNHAFSGVVNGKIYIIGGRQGSAGAGNSSPTDVVEEYDPAKNLWSGIKAPMPTPRSGGGDATYNGKIYVAGGELTNRQWSGSFRALEAYDPATNSWTILPSMPVAKHGQGTVFLGNRLYLASGTLTPGSGFGPDWISATGETDVLEISAK